MSKPTFIVIPLDYINASGIANKIMGQVYRTDSALRIQLAEELKVPEGDDGDGIEEVKFFDLHEFTLALNDTIFGIDVDGSIISYVYFER